MFTPFQQWFVDLFDILGNVAVIIAVVIAIKELNKWRIETLGKKRFELAQKIVLLAYKFRDQFLLFREKTVWFEGRHFQSQGKRVPHNEETLKKELLDILKLIQPLINSLDKFHTLVWEAITILQPEDILPVEDFKDAIFKLQIATKQYYSQQITQVRASQVRASYHFPENQMEEWRQIVFGTDENEDDPVLINIDKGLEELKERMKKYLQ